MDRQEYVPIEMILEELREKLAANNGIDSITLAGSGEPTLNSAIGELIRQVKSMTDIPVSVLTNGSLLWIMEVRDALMEADIVLPSLDAGDERLFHYVNRPHGDISFERMVQGLVDFTQSFPGEVWLEVLLLAGVTGVNAEVEKIAKLVERIGPAKTHLNTVYRPPSEEFAFPLAMEQLVALKEFFPGKVEIIMDREDQDAVMTDYCSIRASDILTLLSRRPCTASEVAGSLGIHATEVLKYLEKLFEDGSLRRILTGGRSFYTHTRSGNGEGKS